MYVEEMEKNDVNLSLAPLSPPTLFYYSVFLGFRLARLCCVLWRGSILLYH